MKVNSRWTVALLATATLAAGGLCGVTAQEQVAEEPVEEPTSEDGRAGALYGEAAIWVAQPVGLGYQPATETNPNDPLDTDVQQMRHGTRARGRYRVGYTFNERIGEFVFTWYSHEDIAALTRSAPGLFVFGETQVVPLHAGVNEDGRSDHFASSAVTRLRDLRLDYYRPAFSNARASAKWFVGLRRTFHSRDQETEYLTLVSPLPPLIPPLVQTPRPDLDPLPDFAVIESKFEGRGVEAGMDFLVPLWRDRILLEAGFAAGVLRGNTDTSYRSATHFYARVDTLGQIVEFLAPPYTRIEDFLDPSNPSQGRVVDETQQLLLPVGLDFSRRSTSSQMLETYLGFRWKAWKGLEGFAGFRNVRLDDAAMDVRVKTVTVSPSGVTNVEDVTETPRAVGYEGFYAGIGYRY